MREHRILAAVYDRMTGPLERAILAEPRSRLLADLDGHILDVGAGTGVNLPHYARAGQVTAAEPDPAMRRRLTARAAAAPVPVEVTGDAAALSHPNDSFDAVVFTLVLCTVASPARALTEARRVLRPGGRLVILEHVRGRGRQARWQDRVTPLWSVVNAGCHPNRDIAAAIDHAGFGFARAESFGKLPRLAPPQPFLAAVATPRS